MEQIKHFMLPEHTNTLYEREAISSIALTKNVADKINEIVDALNSIQQWNYEKHQEQDGTIRKGVLFMKDNLINSLNDLMDLLLKNGYVDERIKIYQKDLIERVDNLLGQVVKGTTSMDAEIIDARKDTNQAVWKTLGNLIRSIDGLNQMLVNDSYFVTEKVDTPIINGWLDTAGIYHSNAETGEIHKCLKFEVSGGESYLIYSEYGWNMPDAVALDESNTMVKLYNRADERKVNDETYVITIPDKAKYLVVNCMYPAKKVITARKIIKVNNKAIVDYMNNLMLTLKDAKPMLSDDLIVETQTGKAIRQGEVFTIDNQGFVIGSCVVTPGKMYQITCGGSFECNPYIFVDHDGIFIDYAPTLPSNGYVSNTYEVIAPINASTLIVGHYNSVKPVVKEVKGYTSHQQWKHLKWCCLGDSLTEVNERTTKRYFDYVRETTGIEVVNMGIGGTGYKRGYEENKAFYQRALNIPNDCDVVTIFGSGNDNTYFNSIGSPTDKGTNTLCGCMNTLIENIYSINPLMKIAIVSPTPWINHQPNDSTKFKDYTEAMKKVCELNGIPFLDLFHKSGFRPNDPTYRNLVFSKDSGNGVHPNEEGHKIISSHFYALLTELIGTY